MPRVALALVLVWFLSLFVVRSVIQWRRTGSTGWKGISGSVGSLEWNAGVLTGLGFVAAGVAPLITLLELPGGTLLSIPPSLHIAGALAATIGIMGALLAQFEMGDSWRVGVDSTEQTTLVTDGLFHWVRNPIFTFMFLFLFGLVLLLPSAASFVAVVLGVTGIEIQVRAVEEPYLRRVHGAGYDDYCARTGRFLPGIGRTIAE